jgi:hypothetical protein
VAGARVYNRLIEHMRSEYFKRGFDEVRRVSRVVVIVVLWTFVVRMRDMCLRMCQGGHAKHLQSRAVEDQRALAGVLLVMMMMMICVDKCSRCTELQRRHVFVQNARE